ncbi:MAG: 50S ribosomal protein L6 [Chloroflexi bacterium]|nr:50S ribosomal protein L6 [Chloroflexota bacterium]
MSRIGKLPIPLPKGVDVIIEGSNVTVKGPKGQLIRTLHSDMILTKQDNSLLVARPSDSRYHKALHGLTRSLVNNMVKGVSEGYKSNLELVGVGYRATMAGKGISIQIGFSHPVAFDPPSNIILAIEGTNKIVISGIDKELVGYTAAKIRSIKPPDSYKGKGIKYEGEKVRNKPGKAGRIGAKK